MTEHVKAQALRFARVSLLAFLAALATTGGRVSWASLWALGAGALETGLRELLPVKAIPAVSAVLAPTSGPGRGLPPVGPGTAARMRTAPAPLAPMTGVAAPPDADGTFPAATVSNPLPEPSPGATSP